MLSTAGGMQDVLKHHCIIMHQSIHSERLHASELRCSRVIYFSDLVIPLSRVKVQRQRQRWTELLISLTDLLRHTHSVTDTLKLRPPLYPLSLVNTDRWMDWISLISYYLFTSVTMRACYCIRLCQGHLFLNIFSTRTKNEDVINQLGFIMAFTNKLMLHIWREWSIMNKKKTKGALWKKNILIWNKKLCLNKLASIRKWSVEKKK